jgi:3-oxoadipate enol-lactonase
MATNSTSASRETGRPSSSTSEVLHHEVSGDGPPLLMGGSLGTNLKMWDGQLPLAERFRLIRFDHRGHGLSPVPAGPYEIEDLGRDVLALMDHLGLERAHYCGLSIGGMVGMWLGANAPERIDRLILLCTSAHVPPPELWEQRIQAILAGGGESIADAVVERWLTPEFAAAHPEVRAELHAMICAGPREGYAWGAGAIQRMDLRPLLERISVPTLIVSGSEDPSTPPTMQEAIAAAIPNIRYETVHAAHIAAVEQPEEINRLVTEFLS